MAINNVTNNQYSIPSINASKSMSNETIVNSANPMPITTRPILEPNVLRDSSNNIYPNFVKKVYSSNQSSSNGSLTESFLRSRASLSPRYMNNEIVTRYDMVSAIPIVLSQIKKSVNKIA